VSGIAFIRYTQTRKIVKQNISKVCICCAKCRYIIECHLFKDEIITKTVFSTSNTIDNVVLNIPLTKMAFQYGYVWLSRHITCVGLLILSLPKIFKLFAFAFESFDFECYLCFHYSVADILNQTHFFSIYNIFYEDLPNNHHDNH
jgi:hypothetical protein